MLDTLRSKHKSLWPGIDMLIYEHYKEVCLGIRSERKNKPKFQRVTEDNKWRIFDASYGLPDLHS